MLFFPFNPLKFHTSHIKLIKIENSTPPISTQKEKEKVMIDFYSKLRVYLC